MIADRVMAAREAPQFRKRPRRPPPAQPVPPADAQAARALLYESAEHHKNGDLDAAETGYRRVLAFDPNDADALHLLALVNQTRGRVNLSICLLQAAIRLRPADADLRNSLAHSFIERGDRAEARRILVTGLQRNPESADMRCTLAELDLADGMTGAARDGYARALSSVPDHGRALGGMGAMLLDEGDLDGALEFLERAAELQPGDIDIQMSFGTVNRRLGNVDDARSAFARAVQADPGNARARFALADAELLAASYRRGFEELQWRAPDVPHPPLHDETTLWDGGSLDGRRLLVIADDDPSEAILLARYIPMIAERGGHAVVTCPRRLVRLFRHLHGVEAAEPLGSPPPAADLHVPIRALPHRFRTSRRTIPSTVPYLFPPPTTGSRRVERLIGQGDGRPAVGVAFGPTLEFDPAPILSAIDVRCFDLRIDTEDRRASAFRSLGVVDLRAALSDLADTAAFIERLDLVIATDVQEARLAAALGAPTLVLLELAPDWPWLTSGNKTPWFPTAHLYRQAADGDWIGAMEELVGDVAAWRRPDSVS